MRRVVLLAALAATSLFAFGSIAMAQDDPPADPPPAEFAPPTPGPVTDNASAGAFAKLYVAQHVRDLIGTDRRRIRLLDANAACLQSPVLDTRFGCVFTLRALVISRRHGWDWSNSSRAHSSGQGRRDHGRGHNRRFRVRQVGCLGFLRINGGPAVTPTAEVVNVECARIPNQDREVVAPTDN
jgi:hypothetical protein